MGDLTENILSLVKSDERDDFWYIKGGRLFETFKSFKGRNSAYFSLFWKQPNVQNKALMFTWKESRKLEKGLVVPGSFLATTTNQEIVTKS